MIERPMSKISTNPQPLLQDGEMQPEYDLSRAVRGRRHHHKVGIDIPGVQFLTNDRGQKTAVLFNLTLHQDLWAITIQQYPNLNNFQFLIDSQQNTRSVFLDFNHHLPLWQAIYSKIIETIPGYDSDRTLSNLYIHDAHS
jgi:hypothetical protein